MQQTIIATALKKLISAYRGVISPWLGTRCRFAPSCSDYALQALDQHGAAKGSIITIKRLCRCHPWGGQGFDPVPGTLHPELSARSHRPDGDNPTRIITPPGANQ